MARHSLLAVFIAVLMASAFMMGLVTMAADTKAVTQFNRMVLKRNFKKSAAALMAAAKVGDAEAQYRLGNLYLIGLGVARNEAMASDLLTQSAAGGNSKAQRLLKRLDDPRPAKTGSVTRPANANREIFVPPVQAADSDAAGNSWLVRASVRGQIKALASLAGKVNVSDLPLRSAAAAGQYDAALLLLRVGASINAEDNKGRTALMLSAASRSPVLTASLLAAGADAARQDNRGDTALKYAIRRCNVEAAIALLRSAEPLAVALRVSPYLHLALQHCATPPLIVALLPRVDIDAVDNAGRSALWQAALQGHAHIARQLIEKRAKVSPMDADGLTALHAAARRCHVDILTALLQASADANAAARDGDTPLMLAAAADCTEGVTLLIAAGAVIDAPNSQGETALFAAVNAAGVDTVKLLLAAGASPALRNIRRETAASIANRLRNADIMAMLASP